MTCYQCGKAPARSGQSTCSACYAAYMREYRKKAARKREERAYLQGVEALRKLLKEVFRTIGRAEMSGYLAVEIVDNTVTKIPRETFT